MDPNIADSKGETPLMLAAGYPCRDQEATLLANGADPNMRDGEGNTALMVAARHGYRGTIKDLLKHGADPTIRNAEGMTALDVAETALDNVEEDSMDSEPDTNYNMIQDGIKVLREALIGGAE